MSVYITFNIKVWPGSILMSLFETAFVFIITVQNF